MLDLEILIHDIVRAIREGNFNSRKISHCSNAMDACPRSCKLCKLTAHTFSAIALDHAHKQENASIKGDGGAIGLTDNPCFMSLDDSRARDCNDGDQVRGAFIVLRLSTIPQFLTPYQRLY
ncbi:hypothetical protein OS493_011483 [Desmophyllum pertusum]|uniref:Uncharacterized protein n=1 Tax=Desmophyllum pertusum TaxID=174260 RepID=A0A9X0CKY7_9CNID|nr:hypothetical protein OS493_011483 [Desmophyllum pertusum]